MSKKVPKKVFFEKKGEVAYALCGGNHAVMQGLQQFFDKKDRGRAGKTASAL